MPWVLLAWAWMLPDSEPTSQPMQSQLWEGDSYLGLSPESPHRKNPLTFIVGLQTNNNEPFPVLNYIIHSALQSGRFGTPTTNLQSNWKDKNKTEKGRGALLAL